MFAVVTDTQFIVKFLKAYLLNKQHVSDVYTEKYQYFDV